MGDLDPVSFNERSARAIAAHIRGQGTVVGKRPELGNERIKWVPRQVLLVKITAELEESGDLTGFYQWEPLSGTITEESAVVTGQVNLDEVDGLPDYAEGKSPPFSAVHWQGLTGMSAPGSAESDYAIGVFGSLIEDNAAEEAGSTGTTDKGKPRNILYFIPMGREKFWARIDGSEETSPSSGIWKYQFTEGYVREGAFTAQGARVSDGPTNGPLAYNTVEIGNTFPEPVGDGTVVEITQQFKTGGTALEAYYNFSLCCDGGGSTGGGGGFGP